MTTADTAVRTRHPMIRYWGRLGLGVLLSLFLGAEVIVYGFQIFVNPVMILALGALYTFVVAVSDDLIARLQLSDRELLLLAGILAILFGGIGNQEMFETDESFTLTVSGLNPFSVVLDSLAWGVYLVWTMHLLRRFIPRRGNSSLMSWRGWTIVGLLALLFVADYISNEARPERLGADSLLLGVVGFLAVWLAVSVWRHGPNRRERLARQSVERSRALTWLSLSFVVVSVLVVISDLEYAPGFPLHLLVFLVFYVPATLIVMARSRIAI